MHLHSIARCSPEVLFPHGRMSCQHAVRNPLAMFSSCSSLAASSCCAFRRRHLSFLTPAPDLVLLCLLHTAANSKRLGVRAAPISIKSDRPIEAADFQLNFLLARERVPLHASTILRPGCDEQRARGRERKGDSEREGEREMSSISQIYK